MKLFIHCFYIALSLPIFAQETLNNTIDMSSTFSSRSQVSFSLDQRQPEVFQHDPTDQITLYPSYKKNELEADQFGIRAGLGTDITGGIAYGVGVNYLVNDLAELGILIFGGKFTETTNNGFNDYTETTRVFVFALMANYLFNYDEDDDVWFFIAGFGLASVYVEYEESSPTDTSLGAPLPGGGSSYTEEAGAGGTIFNIGGGKRINAAWDIRFEIPVIVSFASYEQASSVIPTLIVTAGYRFGQ